MVRKVNNSNISNSKYDITTNNIISQIYNSDISCTTNSSHSSNTNTKTISNDENNNNTNNNYNNINKRERQKGESRRAESN